MAFTEFYCDASVGANINAGDKTANGVVTSTNGNWSTVTNIFTAASGTPFSGVSVGDFASVYNDGATVAVYIARVTSVGGGGSSLALSNSAISGTAPTTSATGRSCTTGGAWKGPNGTSGFPIGFVTPSMTNVAGNPVRVNFKNNATYSITAGFTNSGAQFETILQGYSSSPGDGGKAILDGGTSGASYVLLTEQGGQNIYRDFIFQNNGATGSANLVVNSVSSAIWERCVFSNSRGAGLNCTVQAMTIDCEAFLCNASNTASIGGIMFSAAGCLALRCISHDNAGSNSNGFYVSSHAVSFVGCIADTNGANGFRISTASSENVILENCVAYNNTGAGVLIDGNCQSSVENSIFVSNGTYGINLNAGSAVTRASTNAFYNNTSGQTHSAGLMYVDGSITLTGDPFTAASTGNFTLNNTAGAGAACRAAGRGSFTQTQASYTGTTSYPDVGAAQVSDTAGGGPIGSNMRGGFCNG